MYWGRGLCGKWHWKYCTFDLANNNIADMGKFSSLFLYSMKAHIYLIKMWLPTDRKLFNVIPMYPPPSLILHALPPHRDPSICCMQTCFYATPNLIQNKANFDSKSPIIFLPFVCDQISIWILSRLLPIFPNLLGPWVPINNDASWRYQIPNDMCGSPPACVSGRRSGRVRTSHGSLHIYKIRRKKTECK